MNFFTSILLNNYKFICGILWHYFLNNLSTPEVFVDIKSVKREDNSIERLTGTLKIGLIEHRGYEEENKEKNRWGCLPEKNEKEEG